MASWYSSSPARQPWRRQLLGLTIVTILGVSTAVPAELASTEVTAADSIQVSSEIAPNITQAGVKQVKTSTNNNVGNACVSINSAPVVVVIKNKRPNPVHDPSIRLILAQCTLLKIGLHSLVSTPDSTKYENSTSSYWSSQAQSVDPWCIVSPTTTLEVSKAIGTINLLRIFGLQCPFAIRSGGHTPWAGAATIQNGVELDLSAIKQVTVASDQKSTSIGPGARWLDVYSKLDALSLTVAGGRVATVGVGGLVTGGESRFILLFL